MLTYSSKTRKRRTSGGDTNCNFFKSAPWDIQKYQLADPLVMSKIKVIWNEECNKSCYHDESLHHFCNQDIPWFPLHQDKCHCLMWQECSWNLQVHLISWQNLAYLCMQQKMFLYRLRPKHHSLDHIQMDIARTKLNPARISSCFSDESFLGYLKRIGVRCHSSNMMLRLLQRYILFLSLRWKDSRTK